MSYYIVEYTIPASTGHIQIEAESAKEAVEKWERTKLAKLFNLSEGEDPTVSAITEYTEEQLDDENSKGTPVDVQKAISEAGVFIF